MPAVPHKARELFKWLGKLPSSSLGRSRNGPLIFIKIWSVLWVCVVRCDIALIFMNFTCKKHLKQTKRFASTCTPG